MRIAIAIGKLMMDAVRGHPENRAALERQRGADGQEVLNPLGSLVAAMRQQAMVAHADAPTAGHPPEQQRNEKRLPGEEKQRDNRADVEERHHRGGGPIDGLFTGHSSLQSIEFHGHTDPFSTSTSEEAKRNLNRKKRVLRGLIADT